MKHTQEELAAIVAANAKKETVSTLVVTTSNGNTFDANPVARQDMADAILASSTLGLTESTWRLANNTEVVITINELKEAQAMALVAYATAKSIGV